MKRSSLCVTHAVKHVKWDNRLGQRIPQPPRVQELEACRPWLEAEIELVEPECLVALGKRAARSLLDRAVKIHKTRGEFHESPYGPVVVTHHPSALLRQIDEGDQQRMYEALVDDLRMAAERHNLGDESD